MKAKTIETFTVLSFCLGYFAVMGSLLVCSVPFLATVQRPALEFVMLPAFIACIVFFVLSRRASEL
jgi:hypothetical protein